MPRRARQQGRTRDASITTQDGKLKLLIKPKDSNYLIDASAKSWTLPVELALVFDELIIKGVATPNDANLGEVSAKLYGGTAIGKVTVSWQKGLRLDGNLDVNQLEMRKIASMLSPNTHVSGKLSCQTGFLRLGGVRGPAYDALRLETPFNVQNGALHGVDIQKAATESDQAGSDRRGNPFRAVVRASRHGARRLPFHATQIASGALAATAM